MNLEKLGKPDLSVAGLSLWVNSREYEGLIDYWDGNWLNVVVHCSDKGAKVTVTGPILRVDELYAFHGELKVLNDSLKGKATLECMEMNFNLSIAMVNSMGAAEMIVDITPDHISQSHSFTFRLNQSYFPKILNQISALLERYPLVSKVGRK